MDNIDTLLALEVKQEIARRYFGFRKTIETDTEVYFRNIQEVSRQLEKTVGHELVRIYTLLNQEDLINEFIAITGLPERLFMDSFINTAPTRSRIFSNQCIRGFTRKGCLHNMFFDAYTKLCRDIHEYHRSYQKLAEDHETITQEIQLFYRKNDIQSILQFLRSLDRNSSRDAALSFNTTSHGELERKLQIEPPPPLSELLPNIPAIPEAKTIRTKLKTLVTKACRQQPFFDPRHLKGK
ncbi:MAG: hypothetical protein V2I36_05030 [Desulfopila sp.]|jgi:hypothetical protein|nr:hypothetical protein [Desulfopila sp.]